VNNTVKALVGLVLGLAILGIWFYFVGLTETIATLATVTPVPAILATICWVCALFLRSYKWHVILRLTSSVPFWTDARVYWVSSFLNVLFPFRVGELARSLFLKQLAHVPIATSLPTVLVDRLYSIAVILLGLLCLPLTPFRFGTSQDAGRMALLDGLRWGLGLIAGAFFVILIVLFLLRNQKTRLLHLAEKLMFFVPHDLVRRTLGFLDAMIDGLNFVHSPRSVFSLLAWSLAVLLADALKDHFVLQAFGLDVPVLVCFFGVCLTNLAFVLPSPPGSIGSNEWYATLVYTTGFGYNSVQVASGALFGHVMTTLVVAAGGALAMSSLGITLAEGLTISQGKADA
jgi:uncharacterized protein (TIRG00374 family)